MPVQLCMDGSEELSGDFELRLSALSHEASLDLEALLGTHATVEIDDAEGTRAFDVIACAEQHRGAVENGWRYELILRPWLHVAGLPGQRRGFRCCVKGNRFASVGENATLIVDGNGRAQIRGTKTDSVTKPSNIGVDENQLEPVGNSWIKSIGKEMSFVCGKS